MGRGLDFSKVQMKSVQDYLRELDTEILLDAYFSCHRPDYDPDDHKEMTVSEIQKGYRSAMAHFIEEMRHIEICEEEYGKGIIFAHRSYYDIGIVYD